MQQAWGQPQNKRYPAFTLIELLVVIAVIGLLVALLMPALGSSRERVQRTDCLGNLRQIGQATHMYVNEYGVLLITSDDSGQVLWDGANYGHYGFLVLKGCDDPLTVHKVCSTFPVLYLRHAPWFPSWTLFGSNWKRLLGAMDSNAEQRVDGASIRFNRPDSRGDCLPLRDFVVVAEHLRKELH